ncbi:MAG: TonB family protein [Labilithrix sp.]|nr:TonB family protein [Labilithrix sp.]MCW5817454.1 TonB family protein [Labilithrix sp.]
MVCLTATVALLLWAPSASADPPGAQGVVPPLVQRRRDAIYPAAELATGRHVDVILLVTVDAEGHVTEVETAEPGGRAFDDAAVSAMRQWTFDPARRDGEAIAARVRIPFHFAPPEPRAPSEIPTPEIRGEVARDHAEEVRVLGRTHIPSRGAGDYEVPVGKLALVPRSDAASLLRLAPGTFLTNEGGTGHPYQVFVRGFDAREGQDIEFTVDGAPLNEVGNPHGNGLADTHFIIPEVVRSLRVIEGPFAPQQGNFAVAGSALYELGLDQPGLTLRATAGSFATKRLLAMWRPRRSSPHTFGAVEVFESDGYGDNRASERATAVGGYEGALGASGLYRVLLTSYSTHYGSAGVLRADDVAAGRRSFFGTYDTTQGGDSSRHAASAIVEDKLGDVRLSQSAWLVLRDFRLRQNFTGFVADPQQTWQAPHPQRGDLIDQRSHGLGLGGRGSARLRRMWLGLPQEIEAGYFARHDDVAAIQERDRTGTNVPYKTDLDLDSSLTNIGLYADASFKPGVSWITLRGGARVDHYAYRVQDRCALRTRESLVSVSADTDCFTVDRTGPRKTDVTSSTSASIAQPRATVLLGPFRGFTFSASHGLGSRSFDPQYVNQDLETPFAEVTASEGGAAFARSLGSVDLLVKSVFFRTHVDKDLFFNQTEGRNTLADGTTRTGWAGNARATSDLFDLAASATLVRATFDDTHLLIPYAPAVVLRGDGAVYGDLPFAIARTKLYGSAGTGVSFVAPRPLPLGERSDTIFTVDAAVNVRWRNVTVGVVCTNLTDRRYRIAEYNYPSDFRSQPYPTLVPSRHFVAGEPRAIYGTLTLTFGGDATRAGGT